MKRTIFFALSIVLLFAASAQAAPDFAWVNDFNIQAQADPSGFRARLSRLPPSGSMLPCS